LAPAPMMRIPGFQDIDFLYNSR